MHSGVHSKFMRSDKIGQTFRKSVHTAQTAEMQVVLHHHLVRTEQERWSFMSPFFVSNAVRIKLKHIRKNQIAPYR